MSQTRASNNAPTLPRRKRAARRGAALLAGAAIVLAGLSWFAFVNAEHATGSGTASYRLASEVTPGAGVWHWVGPDGQVRAPISETSRIVPGDRIGLVRHDGSVTDVTLVIPHAAGNDSQRTEFTLVGNATGYELAPVHDGTLDFHRSDLWMLLGAGSAVALAGAGGLTVSSARGRAKATR